MLFTIAWKNIWRNKVRSLVVIIAVMLGLWAGTFILAYAFGMVDQRLVDAIENEISHYQIHHPEFDKDSDPKYYMGESDKIITATRNMASTKALTARMLAMGMVTAPSSSSGGKFIGINPKDEQATTGLQDKIADGEYLDIQDRNKIIIGRKLANKLKLKIRSKLVLTFQDKENNIVSGAFRVKGIFESYNSSYEENNLYVLNTDLYRLMSIEQGHHEIAVLVNDAGLMNTTIEDLKKQFGNVQIESWKELAPELSLMIESMDQYMIIFLIIILLALSFGIVNTMLMAVLERVKEIGMLMAIGMNKIRLFFMIALETIMMVCVAAPLGVLLAYATISYLGIYGMDLSALYAEGYAEFGFKSIIYPKLDGKYYIQIMVLVSIAAVLASIYPAITALKLDPVKAIRKL